MSELMRDLAQAEVLIDLGRDAEAEQRLRTLLAGHPESAAVMLALARAVHRQGRDHEAYELAGRVVALNPESQHGHLVLCDIAVALDDQEGAKQAAEECLRLEPHQWTSHYAHARALLTGRRPRVADAYDEARIAVSLAPDRPEIHTLIGLCLEGLNNRPEAERAYRNALAIDPQHTMAQNNLATLKMGQGRLGFGARMLRQAVTHAPQEKVLHQNLNLVLVLLGRRVLIAVAIAGVVLGLMITQDSPWWARSLVGACFLAALTWALRRFAVNLPRGIRGWGRGALAAVPLQWQLLYAALSLVVLLLAFAPTDVASVAGVGFLALLRIVGLMIVIGWLGGALLSLFRRG